MYACLSVTCLKLKGRLFCFVFGSLPFFFFYYACPRHQGRMSCHPSIAPCSIFRWTDTHAQLPSVYVGRFSTKFPSTQKQCQEHTPRLDRKISRLYHYLLRVYVCLCVYKQHIYTHKSGSQKIEEELHSGSD